MRWSGENGQVRMSLFSHISDAILLTDCMVSPFADMLHLPAVYALASSRAFILSEFSFVVGDAEDSGCAASCLTGLMCLKEKFSVNQSIALLFKVTECCC